MNKVQAQIITGCVVIIAGCVAWWTYFILYGIMNDFINV